MPESIWQVLVGAGLTGIIVALYYRAAIAQKNRQLARKDRELKREKKRERRDKKSPSEGDAFDANLEQQEKVIARLSSEAEKIERALAEKAAGLVELSRGIETHDKWLRLARVSRQMPGLIRRAMLNSLADQETMIAETYRSLREHMELPHVDLVARERFEELSSDERRSLAILCALQASHKALTADMMQIGLFAMSPLLFHDELTHYTILDEEVEAYILDWVRNETDEAFFERVTRQVRSTA